MPLSEEPGKILSRSEMAERLFSLFKAERLSQDAYEEGLSFFRLSPDSPAWYGFLARVLTKAGPLMAWSGLVMLIAWNWHELPKFFKLGLFEALALSAAVLAFIKPGKARHCALGAALLGGALLALYGQIYQTGANSFELFRAWFVLALPLFALARTTSLALLLWLTALFWVFLCFFPSFDLEEAITRPAPNPLIAAGLIIWIIFEILHLAKKRLSSPISEALAPFDPKFLLVKAAAIVAMTLIVIRHASLYSDSFQPDTALSATVFLFWAYFALMGCVFIAIRPDHLLTGFYLFSLAAVIEIKLITGIFDKISLEPLVFLISIGLSILAACLLAYLAFNLLRPILDHRAPSLPAPGKPDSAEASEVKTGQSPGFPPSLDKSEKSLEESQEKSLEKSQGKSQGKLGESQASGQPSLLETGQPVPQDAPPGADGPSPPGAGGPKPPPSPNALGEDAVREWLSSKAGLSQAEIDSSFFPQPGEKPPHWLARAGLMVGFFISSVFLILFIVVLTGFDRHASFGIFLFFTVFTFFLLHSQNNYAKSLAIVTLFLSLGAGINFGAFFDDFLLPACLFYFVYLLILYWKLPFKTLRIIFFSLSLASLFTAITYIFSNFSQSIQPSFVLRPIFSLATLLAALKLSTWPARPKHPHFNPFKPAFLSAAQEDPAEEAAEGLFLLWLSAAAFAAWVAVYSPSDLGSGSWVLIAWASCADGLLAAAVLSVILERNLRRAALLAALGALGLIYAPLGLGAALALAAWQRGLKGLLVASALYLAAALVFYYYRLDTTFLVKTLRLTGSGLVLTLAGIALTILLKSRLEAQGAPPEAQGDSPEAQSAPPEAQGAPREAQSAPPEAQGAPGPNLSESKPSRPGPSLSSGGLSPIRPRPSALTWGLALVVMALLIIVNAQVVRNESLLSGGQPMTLQLTPVDPLSILQGYYISLSIAAERPIASAWAVAPPAVKGRLAVMAEGEDSVSYFKRLYQGEPLAEGEALLAFKTNREGDAKLASDSYFFQEGSAQRFEKARYARLRVNAEGRSILESVLDERLQAIEVADSGD
ncbi:MAG: GDYXXLXY domain-containing protein [Deltaproteobacteria bacterium]|jgi:uncharacterized membrane-anchored protein|nr:GDYXXLXY domain-containing protein [Deltaproteobacteria bacterium]